MQLHSLTNGAITGTGTLKRTGGGAFGGALINTDNTNAMTVAIHLNDANGKKIFNAATISSGFFIAPIDDEGADCLYYSITGTGGTAQLFSWVS